MNDKPNLGMATTRELLNELVARIEIQAPELMNYKTFNHERTEKNKNQLNIEWEKQIPERKENG